MRIEDIKPNTDYFAIVEGEWQRVKTDKKLFTKKNNIRCIIKNDYRIHGVKPSCIAPIDDPFIKEEVERAGNRDAAIRQKMKEETREAQEDILRKYGVDISALDTKNDEEIRNIIYAHLVVPSYNQWKNTLFKKIKNRGIKNTEEHIKDIFDSKGFYIYDALDDINCSGDCYGIYLSFVWDLLYDMVERMNADCIFAFSYDDGLCDAHAISDNMTAEFDYKRPEKLQDQYIERLGKEDMQEFKTFLLSLAKDD